MALRSYREENKTAAVRTMFNAIAPRYDFLNHLLSFGTDFRWRRKAIDLLKPLHPQRILDVGTGTADFAIEALRLRPLEVVGVDIAEEMLKLGNEKLRERNLNGVVRLEVGNAERLQFADGSFDAVTVAFGVRNFENLELGLAEMCRVLKPGGAALILEFSSPKAFPFRHIYGFYFSKILPLVGGAISRNRDAYQYLPQSVEGFSDGEGFLKLLKKVGFTGAQQFSLTFGIASIYLAFK